MAKDYTGTLNLPKTDFPMRANLPEREPNMMKYWDSIDLYGKMQECRSARPRSCCTTALRSRTAISTWERR